MHSEHTCCDSPTNSNHGDGDMLAMAEYVAAKVAISDAQSIVLFGNKPKFEDAEIVLSHLGKKHVPQEDVAKLTQAGFRVWRRHSNGKLTRVN